MKKEVLLHLGKSFGPATNDSAALSDDDGGEQDSPGGSQDEIELTLLK